MQYTLKDEGCKPNVDHKSEPPPPQFGPTGSSLYRLLFPFPFPSLLPSPSRVVERPSSGVVVAAPDGVVVTDDAINVDAGSTSVVK